jgi:hypothetical protein
MNHETSSPYVEIQTRTVTDPAAAVVKGALLPHAVRCPELGVPGVIASLTGILPVIACPAPSRSW